MDRNAFRMEAEVAFGRVRDAMTSQVVTFEPSTRASDAALRLSAEQIAGAPVVDGSTVVGVISLGDLLAREGHTATQTSGPFMRGERHLAHLTVAEVMTREVITVRADAPLVRAIELMDAEGVNRLPVLDDRERVVGILARDDVIAAVARAIREFEPAALHPSSPKLVPD